MSINFVKEPKPKGVLIPSAALKICGLQGEKKLNIHAQEKSLVILPNRMTAMELLHAVEHLGQLEDELCEYLMKACGKCEECGEALCPFSPEMDNFNVSPELRDAAGIPEDTRLWACPDLDAKTIHIVEAPEVGLHNIQSDLLAKLTEDGICLGELQTKLMDKVVVYGG